MYTATNIRFSMYNDNGDCTEYFNFYHPFYVSGNMFIGDGDITDDAYYHLDIEETSAKLTVNYVGKGTQEWTFTDVKAVIQHIETVYSVSAEGFEYSVEEFIICVLNGNFFE